MSWFVLIAVATLGLAGIMMIVVFNATDHLFALDMWQPESTDVDSQFGADIYRVTSIYAWIIGALPMLTILAVGVAYLIRSR